MARTPASTAERTAAPIASHAAASTALRRAWRSMVIVATRPSMLVETSLTGVELRHVLPTLPDRRRTDHRCTRAAGVPGPNPMSVGMTILVGLGGSLIGGLIGRVLFGRPGGWLLAVLSTAGIVYFMQR